MITGANSNTTLGGLGTTRHPHHASGSVAVSSLLRSEPMLPSSIILHHHPSPRPIDVGHLVILQPTADDLVRKLPRLDLAVAVMVYTRKKPAEYPLPSCSSIRGCASVIKDV